MGYDPYHYINSLPADAIGELHLGGFTAEEDAGNPGAELLVDTHASRIAEHAWDLYAYAIRCFGPKPTLIEWDNDIPPLPTLLGEAARANQVAARAITSEADRVVAR
jgi:uncharacterized protein